MYEGQQKKCISDRYCLEVCTWSLSHSHFTWLIVEGPLRSSAAGSLATLQNYSLCDLEVMVIYTVNSSASYFLDLHLDCLHEN